MTTILHKGRALKAFVEKNKESLLAEYRQYGFQPHIDYCPADGGCGHAHSFEAFAEREFDAWRLEQERLSGRDRWFA